LGIGDWGLGIGDWAQSPIPNPQSPIPNPQSSTKENLMQSFPDTYKDLLKFGIVAYRDHPPEDTSFVTQIHQFNNHEKAESYLSTLQANGGGDFPEAAMDGLNDRV
jgi:cell division septation protein DedD